MRTLYFAIHPDALGRRAMSQTQALSQWPARINCCLLAILLLLIGCSTQSVGPGKKAPERPRSLSAMPPRVYQERGNDFFEKGAFADAVTNWNEALQLYAMKANFEEQSALLLKLAQAYEKMGEYTKALQALERALAIAQESGNMERTAAILGAIGNAYVALGPEEQAYRYLNQGLAMAQAHDHAAVAASILNNLGNFYASQKRYAEAASMYAESAVTAREIENHEMTAIALTNEANALIREGHYKEAETKLQNALEESVLMAPSHYKAYTLINIGIAFRGIGLHMDQTGNNLRELATKTLEAAVVECATFSDSRGLSYALGYLGRLMEDEQRYEDALHITERAIWAAQSADAPESLYQWEWQKGRLLRHAKRTDAAISAYRRATSSLESVRQEMPHCYGRPQTSFREPASPLYMECVDLLLQRAAVATDAAEAEPYLLEAREKLESLKVTELRDYFNDECVDAAKSATTRLDIVSESAVVIYPILLEDRLELLVSLPSGMKRFCVPVGARLVTERIRSFRRNLEKLTTREYMDQARELYDCLVRPLEEDLRSSSAATLVFVPDGPLRTIPMAALHDGHEFLVEKYAVAVTPGLDLTEPRPIERKNLGILALGLSDAVQGFPPLPFVGQEISTIRDLFKSKVLFNENFSLAEMEKALRGEHFTVLHIASHGQFENDLNNTFLLTFDGQLTMNRLDEIVGLLKFREDPLELLTLSACDTATGDDRAALGLAGIAVRAGARSALGTLWHINDQSSSILVSEFYRQLLDPALSRAAALQRAQLHLLNDRKYHHPRYWAPFLLINNWL
jgi:CHAT domain-containing protein/Tfp pilus assembly protein PilF